MSLLSPITPSSILHSTSPSPDFLCDYKHTNTYGIEFLSFAIINPKNEEVLFEVKKESSSKMPDLPADFDYDRLRSINYCFPKEFLRLKTVSTKLTFKNVTEVKNFRMIERHYFKNRLLQNYDFTFPYCMPNSVNSWEAIYDLPQLSEEDIQEMTNNPYSVTSDSFYFVDDVLIMQNKAAYSYDK